MIKVAHDAAIENKETPDLVVGLTGDTLVTDSYSFVRRYKQMKERSDLAMVSQAWGQRFWNRDGDLHRIQGKGCPDFACCIFILDGTFFLNTGCFTNIKLVNEYTSEECLGAELVRNLPNQDFSKYVSLLNESAPQVAYFYNDGVVYHARNGRPGR